MFDLDFSDMKIDGISFADDIADIGDTFDLSGIEPSVSQELNKNRFCKPKIHRRVKVVRWDYAKKAADALAPMVDAGERIYGYVGGSFVWGDFIEALIYAMGRSVKEATFSTLSYSDINIDSMERLLRNGHIENFRLVTSDMFFAKERARVKKTHEVLGDYNFTFATAGIHSKVILLHLEGDQKIVISGSSNLQSSGSLEQFDIESCDGLYDFNKEILDLIIQEFSTTKKSPRHAALYDIVAQALPPQGEIVNSYLKGNHE